MFAHLPEFMLNPAFVPFAAAIGGLVLVLSVGPIKNTLAVRQARKELANPDFVAEFAGQA
jgi:hypothetical protein